MDLDKNTYFKKPCLKEGITPEEIKVSELPLRYRESYLRIIDDVIYQKAPLQNSNCNTKSFFLLIPSCEFLENYYISKFNQNPLDLELAYMKLLITEHPLFFDSFNSKQEEIWDYKKVLADLNLLEDSEEFGD